MRNSSPSKVTTFFSVLSLYLAGSGCVVHNYRPITHTYSPPPSILDFRIVCYWAGQTHIILNMDGISATGIIMTKPGITAVKPMDVLRQSIDKSVMVEVKGRRVYSGVLEGYDIYMNLVIKNAGEIINSENKGVHQRVLVRGDNVIYISPSTGD